MKKLISTLLSLSLLCNSIPANTYYTFAEEDEGLHTEEIVDVDSTEESSQEEELSESTEVSSETEASEEQTDSQYEEESSEILEESSEEVSETLTESKEETSEISEESSAEEEISKSQEESSETDTELNEVPMEEPTADADSNFDWAGSENLSVQPYAISGPDTVMEGSSIQLSGKDNVRNCGYTQEWSSSDSSIATVDRDGKVTGLKPGSVTITHTYCTRNNSSHWRHQTDSEVYTVTVTEDPTVVTIQWVVNGALDKTERVKEGEIPSYVATPTKTILNSDGKNSTAMDFAGWSTVPNSYDHILDSIPEATQDTTYYAIFTYKATFYFVLEGKSSTSGEAKDYMYMGTGKVLVPDDYKLGSNKWTNSNHDILGLILEYPTDAQIREGIKAAYDDYSDDWNYELTYLSYAHITSSVGYDYKLLTNGYSNSFHIDASIALDKATTAGILYRITNPDGTVVTNSVTHEKNTTFDLQNTVRNSGSFRTDNNDYVSTKVYNGIRYTFDGWYSNPAYTQKAPDTLTVTEPRTFYARYIADTKNVTYDANGGAFSDQETVRSAKYEVGRNVTLLKEEPTREGYTFAGWETADVQQNANGSFTMPSHDVSFKAKWEIKQLTLIIHYVDEKGNKITEDHIEEVEYNQDYHVENPTVTGYTTEEKPVSGLMGTENLEVTVAYTANEHTLKIRYVDIDGNELETSYEETLKFKENYEVTSPSVEGYHLADENQKIISGTMADANENVTVRYELNHHTVTYKIDGKIDGEVETVEYGQVLTLREEPTKKGYTFSGWSTLPATMPDQDVTVEGSFTINSYNLLIHYNFENGTLAKEDYKKSFEYEGNYRVETPAITGYTPTISVVEGLMDAADVEVFVVYKADSHKLTIRYEDSNGKKLEEAHQEVLKFGDSYEVTSPAVEGYHLVNASQAVISGTMSDVDETITVKYALNVHKVTYLVDGETFGNEDEVEYGKALPAREKPTKNGYTFVGWENLPKTMPDQDVTVTGKFVINHYTLTTSTDGHADITASTEYDYSESETTTVKFQAHEGYTITSVFVDGQLVDADESVTLDHLSNHTVRVNTTVNVHKITYILDGNEYRTVNQAYGTVLSALPMEEREGYTFSGWNGLPKTMPDQDVVVNGSYTINSYDLIIHYVYEDQTEAHADHAEKVNYKTEYKVPSPVIEGYTADTLIVQDVMKAGKTEVTVVYRINRYALTTNHDANSTVSASEQYDYSAEETSRVAFSANKGYHLTKVTVDGKELSAEEIEKGVIELDHKADHTVAVESAVNQYTLTYRVDGKEVYSEKVDYAAAPKGTAAPAKEGHTFVEWSSMPETMPDHDVSVDAVFEVNEYTLRIRYVDSKNVSIHEGVEKTVSYGETYSVNSPVSVKGYHLRQAEQAVISGTMGADDLTIDVVYDLNLHKITYLVDNETYQVISEVEYGSSLSAIETPSREGYTFHGWNGLPKTMPDEDVVVTGSFEINSYALTTTHDAHSSISASTGYEYSETEKTVVEFSAHEGYTVTKVTVDGTELSAEDMAKGKVTLDHQSNHTVDVKTTVNTYKLTYLVDDEELQVFDQVEFDSPIETVEAPTKEGYTFIGWENLPEKMPAHDVVAKAKFTINNYKLTVHYEYSNGDQAWEDAVKTVEFKQDYEIKSPTIKGYTANVQVVKGTMGSKDVETTVVYTINHHDLIISYVDAKGNALDSHKETLDYNTPYEVESPTIEGYHLVQADQKTIKGVMGDEKEEITVQYDLNVHNIVYKVDGEVFETKKDVAYGTKLSLIDEPTKEGYTFSGWSTLPETMPDDEVVVEGRFTINSYNLTVHYVYEDNSTAEKDYTAKVDFNKSYRVETPKKSGYTPNIQIVEGTMGAVDAVITVKYTANRHRIIYFLDGNAYHTLEDVAYGTALTLIDEPIREGHTFSGWSTLPTTMPDEDVLVMGTFSVNHHDVVYRVDDEVFETIENVAYGTDLSLIEEPTKEGYTFSGWSTLPTTMPDEDVLVTGSFSINHHNVVYRVDGEEFETIENVAYGTDLSLIEEPTKEGYTFSGWSTLPTTMPDEEVIVEGSFTINSYAYTVEYYYDDILRNTVQRTADFGTQVDLSPEINLELDENSYLLVSEDHTIRSISVNVSENMIRVYYESDNIGEKDETGLDQPDGISDKYQVRVHFVAEGGTVSLSDTVVTLYDENGELSVDGVGHLSENQIPTTNPNTGYNGGKWDVTPTTELDIAEEMTFTIRYDRIPDPIEDPEEDPTPIIRVITPVEPEIPDDPEIEIEDDPTPLVPDAPEKDPEVNIEDEETPLAPGEKETWALVNLILMILTGGASLVLLVGYFLNKKKEEEEEEKEQTERKKKGAVRLASLIPALAAIILFFLTENLSNPMVLTDKWTLAMAVIALVQVVLVVFSKKEDKEKEEAQA